METGIADLGIGENIVSMTYFVIALIVFKLTKQMLFGRHFVNYI